MSTEQPVVEPSQNEPVPRLHTAPGLSYAVLDVFAERALEGSPLAVFADGRKLSGAQMQAIARELNLSETTFVLPRDPATEQREGIHVRIFTTQEELSFAGHPTLGTATWLHLHHSELAGARTVELALAAGKVPVHFDAQQPGPGVTGSMRQNDPVFGATLDRHTVAAALGLSPEDLDPAVPPQIVSTGTAFAVVLVHGAALPLLRVDHNRARVCLDPHRARWFYVVADDEHAGATHFRARMQFYSGEDPATGSAAGCAIALLVQKARVPSRHTATIMQGVEIGLPSRILASAAQDGDHITDVHVGGRTIPVASGRFFLP